MPGVLWSAPPSPLSAASGSAVTGSTSLTAGTPAPQPVIPAGIILPASKLKLEADIELTSTSSTPTVTVGFYIGAEGGAIGSATVLVTAAGLAVSASATAWLLRARYLGTFRTLSASAGVIHGNMEVWSMWNVGLTGAPGVSIAPATAAARTVSTLNTAQSNQLDVGITFSSSAGSISATVTDFLAELIG